MPELLRSGLAQATPALQTYGQTRMDSAARPAHRRVPRDVPPPADLTGTCRSLAHSFLAVGRSSRPSVGEGIHPPNARPPRLSHTTRPNAPAPATGNLRHLPEWLDIADQATHPASCGPRALQLLWAATQSESSRPTRQEPQRKNLPVPVQAKSSPSR